MASSQLTSEQIVQICGLVAEYITDRWEKAVPHASPLSPAEHAAMDGFFLPLCAR